MKVTKQTPRGRRPSANAATETGRWGRRRRSRSATRRGAATWPGRSGDPSPCRARRAIGTWIVSASGPSRRIHAIRFPRLAVRDQEPGRPQDARNDEGDESPGGASPSCRPCSRAHTRGREVRERDHPRGCAEPAHARHLSPPAGKTAIRASTEIDLRAGADPTPVLASMCRSPRRPTVVLDPDGRSDNMIRAGDTIENPVTGERLVFKQISADTDGELVLFECFVQPRLRRGRARAPVPAGAVPGARGVGHVQARRARAHGRPRRRHLRPGRDGPPVLECGSEEARFACEVPRRSSSRS